MDDTANLATIVALEFDPGKRGSRIRTTGIVLLTLTFVIYSLLVLYATWFHRRKPIEELPQYLSSPSRRRRRPRIRLTFLSQARNFFLKAATTTTIATTNSGNSKSPDPGPLNDVESLDSMLALALAPPTASATPTATATTLLTGSTLDDDELRPKEAVVSANLNGTDIDGNGSLDDKSTSSLLPCHHRCSQPLKHDVLDNQAKQRQRHTMQIARFYVFQQHTDSYTQS